jgi:hypothetical protein
MKTTFLKVVLLLIASAITIKASAQISTSVFSKVNNGNDDAEEGVSSNTGVMDLTSSDLEIMTDGTRTQWIGIRFTGLKIPKGVIIDSAFVQFTNVGDKNPVNGNAIIRGELTGNSGTFATTAFNISSRVRTADSIVWPGSTNATWGTTQPNAKTLEQRTPNLKNIIQTMINQSSWTTGNPITILMNGTGVRNARSFNGSSSGAAELTVFYTQNSYTPGIFPITKNSVWKFLDNGVFPGSTWKDSTFNDSVWLFKNGNFGYGLPATTSLSFGSNPSSKHITTYFRTQISMTNTMGFDTLIFRVQRDDGAVVYINGVEAFRMNMPTGPINSTTLASSDIDSVGASLYHEIRIPNTLINGMNTIAVEVHQHSASSADKVFDMEILGQRVPMTVINFPIPKLSEWSYLDDGTDQDTAWRLPNFFDRRWNYGPAILGYGDPSATTLSFGPNSANKYITYYFRKRVNIPSVSALTDTIIFSIMRDDGAIVYVNGNKIFQTNMPDTGVINYLTWSTVTVDGAAERQYNDFKIPKSVFVNGINTIAVEVHQRDGTSSDLTFEMEVKEDPRTLNLIAPTIGQSITAGQNFNINWYNIPSIDTINIQLSLDNRATWTTLSTNLPASNKPFIWAVPNINNSVTWIRISDKTGVFRDSANIWIYPAPTPFNPCADSLHIGCFTSVPQARNQILKLPSSHIFQQIGRQGQTHSLGGTVGTNLDFTGFMPWNLSNKRGAVGVNEENTPGGVSVFYIRFNDTTGTWQRDSSGKVNLSHPALVQSTRNCSGGLTPWGTIITSEESFNTGDVNADGYQDVGWHVEYNPWTRQVRDYNGDGIPDKLWAMGRMSHENIAVANDSVTAYFAEDGGTSCVYKFVASQKTRLDSGTLYVLQRNAATGSTGQWLMVPNSTQAQRNTINTIASGLGGTNFNGPEDVEINPLNGMIYFTSKSNSRIYRFTDNGMTVSNFEDYVGNAAVNYTMNVEGGGTQTVNWGSGIDNLVFDNLGNLWAQQDGGNGHIWVIRPDHTPANPKVDVFATTPAGSETSGLTFTPDFRQGFLSVMGASGSNTASAIDAAGASVVFNVSNTVVIGRRQFLGSLAAIPVEFAEFNLERSGKSDVFVKWSTATELNNQYFEVERSIDGRQFTSVAKVYSQNGNSTTLQFYQYKDLNLAPAVYYYRIKQVDFDGSHAFSAVLSINLTENNRFSVNEVYPNPFSNKVHISINTAAATTLNLTMNDINGRIIKASEYKVNEGFNAVEFNTADLASGLYFITLKSQGETYTYKLIK